MKDFIITKNRGWRGLAEVRLYDELSEGDTVLSGSRVFSFSPQTWHDLINNHVLVIEETIDGIQYYTVLHFDVADGYHLPKPTQQRSVLIKNVICHVTHQESYPIEDLNRNSKFVADGIAKYKSEELVKYDYKYCWNCKQNKNNHTQSVYNQVGIRVTASLF